ncbi:MAG TPA: transcriptional regulator NrdR, partial [Alphaproteobacteria bacterium]|nr:transcriptional regulator NrdR [Alphaproteobacteria bacterium]
IAYIRFASVYKDFKEIKDFEEFVRTIDELVKPVIEKKD